MTQKISTDLRNMGRNGAISFREALIRGPTIAGLELVICGDTEPGSSVDSQSCTDGRYNGVTLRRLIKVNYI